MGDDGSGQRVEMKGTGNGANNGRETVSLIWSDDEGDIGNGILWILMNGREREEQGPKPRGKNVLVVGCLEVQ